MDSQKFAPKARLARGRGLATATLLTLGLVTTSITYAQNSAETKAGIDRYRELLQDGNPAELSVARGEGLWKQKRGPKNLSLEACDLGKGAGVVKAAYAELPRYFADTDSVMDFESRLVHCMVTLQGFDRAQITAKPFSGTGERETEIESLTAFVVEESRGVAVNVPQKHPKEIASFKRGEKMFYFRGGPYDFSCASCHANDEQRIRLQELPNLNQKEAAQRAYTTWPAYRVSQGALRTMQWRIYDCFRQQRFPELVFVSPGSVDLITYLGVKAQGGKMDSPAIKR